MRAVFTYKKISQLFTFGAFSCGKSFEQTAKDTLIVEVWRWERCRGDIRSLREQAKETRQVKAGGWGRL